MLQYNPTVSGSLQVTGTISATQGITGSFSGSVAGLPTDVSAFSASLSTRITATESTSSAYVTTSGSVSTRVTAVEATASQYVTASGSLSTRVTATEATASSFVVASGSLAARISSNEARTGSYATTGSNSFIGSQTITGSLTATGTIVAQTLVVQTITSSVVYSSGSNIFGLNSDNSHQFTGSVLMSGSQTINGALSGTSANFSGNNHSLASNNTLRFTDTDTATEANQQIGKIEFYSSDSSTPGAGVKAYIGAFAQDTTPDAYLSFATQDGSGTPNPVERLRISSEGNVGIGTASPSQLLHVNASSGAVYSRIQNNNNSLYLGLESGGIAQVSSDVSSLKVMGATYISFESSGSERMRILANGGVSIGKTTNTFASSTRGSLEINGTNDSIMALYSNSVLGGYIFHSGTDMDILNNISNGSLKLYTNGTERMRITSAGNVGIGTTSPAYKFQVQTASGINSEFRDNAGNALAINLNTGVVNFLATYEVTATSMDFTFTPTTSAGGQTEAMRIKANGNVGIGTASPTYKLDVVGTSGTEIIARFTASGTDIDSQINLAPTGVARGIINATANGLAFAVVGSTKALITSGGNVLIGTTTDAGYKLDVNGTGRFYSSGSASVVIQRGNTSSGATIDFNTSTTNKWFMGLRGLVNDDFYIYNQTAGANNLILSASTGAATFSSSVTAASATATGGFMEIQGSVNAVKTLYLNRYGVASGSQHRLRAENGYFEIASANSEPIVLTGGNVGIGTTSPSQLLTLGGAATVQMTLRSSTTTGGSEIYFGDSDAVYRGFIGYQHDGDYMQFSTAASERMRITSGGNVSIGTTGAYSKLTVMGDITVNIGQGWYTNTYYAGGFHYLSTGYAGYFAMNSGDGSFVITTAPSGTGGTAATLTERMRITSGGYVYINATSNPLPDNAQPQLGITAGTSTDAVNIKHTQNGNNSLNIWQTGTTSHNAIAFYKGDTQTNRGLITVTTSGTTYNSTSDYRLKENVVPLENGLDRLMQLKPSKFNWIETGIESEGFIAHEVQEIFPDAVTGEKDAVYASTGNIKPQSVDYGRITPLLVKAIQELKTENDILKEILQRNNIQ